MENIPSAQSPRESGYFEGKRYDIERLYEFAKDIPEELLSIDEFSSVVSAENESWTGTDGKIIGPINIVKDWNAAQLNPLWQNHVESVRHVNLEIPIIISHTGHVIDGQHRVVKAIITGEKNIKVKRLPPDIPAELEF